jgi:hypothetical protein
VADDTKLKQPLELTKQPTRLMVAQLVRPLRDREGVTCHDAVKDALLWRHTTQTRIIHSKNISKLQQQALQLLKLSVSKVLVHITAQLQCR